MTLEDAAIVAHGHRSLVLRLHSDDDYVVKIGKTSHILHEDHIHALVDRSGCQHLRKAVTGSYGQVEGAGPDLSYIGLQHYCQGKIQPDHLYRIDRLLSHVDTVQTLNHVALYELLPTIQECCSGWTHPPKAIL